MVIFMTLAGFGMEFSQFEQAIFIFPIRINTKAGCKDKGVQAEDTFKGDPSEGCGGWCHNACSVALCREIQAGGTSGNSKIARRYVRV